MNQIKKGVENNENEFIVKDLYFTNEEDFRHYGGNHLNLHVGKDLPHTFMAMDGDLITYKDIGDKHYRFFIEFKPLKGEVKGEQLKALQREIEGAKIVNENSLNLIWRVYVIYSSYPFGISIIENMITGKKINVNRQELDEFLCFNRLEI